MIWLLLSILCSTFIFVVFKLFDRYSVNNLQAIVVNYFVAFAVGIASGGLHFNPVEVISKPWFFSILILGFMFITLFQLMAAVSQKFGVSAVSVAVKMSLAIPVLAAFVLYQESISTLKIAGVICALAAVYMATYKPEKTKGHPWQMFMPVLLFLGSGLLDAFINYNQRLLVPAHEHAYFASGIFLIAGLLGILFVSIRKLKTHVPIKGKNIIGGIFLGIPNYGSIYFLLRALEVPTLESSVVFPINNVGIVLLSVIVGRSAFSERLSGLNKAGIAFAIIAIALITFHQY